jgi:hypothetical protein
MLSVGRFKHANCQSWGTARRATVVRLWRVMNLQLLIAVQGTFTRIAADATIQGYGKVK